MDAMVALINSKSKLDAFSALAENQTPFHAIMDYGVVITEAEIRASPKTRFLVYTITPEMPQWGPDNPYWQRVRAATTDADYILDANGERIKFDPQHNTHALLPSIALAVRIAEVYVARFRELPKAAQTIYMDNTWQQVPNWAWTRIESALAAKGIAREFYNALLRAYQHELIVRLRRAGVKIVANTGSWADPLFDEITIEHERPGQGGIPASTALALFVKQQEYVPGSIGTLWYAPPEWNAPQLARKGTWA